MLQKVSFNSSLAMEEEIFSLLAGKNLDPVVNYLIRDEREEVALTLSGEVEFTLYFPVGEQEPEPGWFREVRAMDPNATGLRTEVVDEVALHKKWQDYFRPFNVGKSLRIIPYGLEDHLPPGRLPLYLDPGLAFGSGTHPTTHSCLETLEILSTHLGRDASILDCGSGTGILSCALGLLGFNRLFCLDIEPEAIAATKANFRTNNLPAPNTFTGDLGGYHPAQKFDLIVANIHPDPLITHQKKIIGWLNDEGFLLLSGILRDNLGKLVPFFESPLLHHLSTREEGEWATPLWQRRK